MEHSLQLGRHVEHALRVQKTLIHWVNQRTLEGMTRLSYCCPKMSIPELSCCWRKMLEALLDDADGVERIE